MQRTALVRAAAKLDRGRRGAKRPPALLAFTDPLRSGDLDALAARLPRGAALVYRAFGAVDAPLVAHRLRRITWRHGVRLLIGADDHLARLVRADGVHLPERLAWRARRLRRKGWLITAAAHSLRAGRRAISLGAQAVVVSPILPSESASASAPIGTLRLAVLRRKIGGPVYAMGGINGTNARRVVAAGVAGLAAVGALTPAKTLRT